MLNIEALRQRWQSGLIQYATTDASKTIKDSKRAGASVGDTNLDSVYLVVTRLHVKGRTASANSVTIKDESGAVILAVITNLAANAQEDFEFSPGIALPADKALIATSTAGAAIDIHAEGYYDGFEAS